MINRLAIAGVLALLCATSALAAPVQYESTQPNKDPVNVSAAAPLPVTGSFSATTTGFRPTAYGTPITATTGGVTGTLPAGAEVVATNTAASIGVYCALGASASTSSQYIAPGGGWFGFAISGDTQLTCITASSTAVVNMSGGSGLPTGTGGGVGSGGGGAIFGPTAAGSAAANPPVLGGGTADGTATGTIKNATVKAASTAPASTDTSLVVAQNPNSATPDTTAAALTACATGATSCTWQQRLAGILASIQGPIPTQASTVSIGGVGVLAGTASVGSMGLDPSLTPATTVPINISTATDTQLVAASGSTSIYVTGGLIIAGGTGTITFEYGTGSNCATGKTALSGAFPLVANVGFIIPANTVVTPSGKALCVLTVGAVQYSGMLGDVQK
jgi:hypothetical protein